MLRLLCIYLPTYYSPLLPNKYCVANKCPSMPPIAFTGASILTYNSAAELNVFEVICTCPATKVFVVLIIIPDIHADLRHI